MAGRKKGAPNRSEFIRNLLESNRRIKLAAVQEAWTKSGQKGEIKSALFYQVKRKMKRGGRKTKGAAAPFAAAASNGYLGMEVALDKLVTQADAMNNKPLAEALRVARRMASAKLV
jgi:metal-responsive CopG/Arc/MetJ family transcriptional regulator